MGIHPAGKIMRLGADCHRQGACSFTVWAPFAKTMEVRIVAPTERLISMERDEFGYWKAIASGLAPGARYVYKIECEKERPDPASRFQPGGVHGPSEIVDHAAFRWEDDDWKGIALQSYVLYELHVGTFTKEGTFDAVIPHLDYLKGLGITAIELMPVAQFPGARNWGYDGVFPFAVQNSYGGPEGLKRLVNACHAKGLAVVLDVVYNHLGPEGNYLWDYGPYFTDRYKTPWGDAINFDGAYSDEVKRYLIESALAWVDDYHIDALRIDAIHGIFDFSAKHFLQELGEAVHHRAEELGRHVYIIPESDLNDVRVITPRELGGYGLDALWNDDFHHALHALLTGEHNGYYEDFGKLEHLRKACTEGFVYSGQYSRFRKRRHGSSSKGVSAHRFVVFSQNHDQVGNRMRGERLPSLVSFEQLKLAAGVVLLSPFIPLLFMGEEYGETAPFQYFVSYSDEDLINSVRKGRKEEFEAFGWDEAAPDPQAAETFLNSKINPGLRFQHENRILFEFYKNLIRLRKEMPAFRQLSKDNLDVLCSEAEKILFLRRWSGRDEAFCLYNFSDREQRTSLTLPNGRWDKMLDSSEETWGGMGAAAEPVMESQSEKLSIQMQAHSFVLYKMSRE